MERLPKIGDFVRVKSNIGDPKIHPIYVEDMRPWLGKVVEVKGYASCGEDDCVYIVEDKGKHMWPYRWLDPADAPDTNAQRGRDRKPGKYIRVSEDGNAVYSVVRKEDFGTVENDQRKVRLADMMEALQKRESGKIETPLLPTSARHYIRQGEHEVVVVEHGPRQRTILSENGDKFTIALPYTVYLFNFDHGEMPNYTSRLFFRTEPLKSLNDKLYATHLTHMVIQKGRRSVGSICMGADPPKHKTLDEKIQANLAYYWERAFRLAGDGGNEYFMAAEIDAPDERLRTFRRWQEEGVRDPLFVLNVKWRDSNLTLGDAIKETLGENIDKKKNAGFDDLLDIVYRAKEVQ